VDEAIALYAEKGDTVSSTRARRLLGNAGPTSG
jgi:hypothetical protein